MATDAKIEAAVKIGQKNQHTAGLVRNWCAHVTIQKAGGVGMIEASTGLPIGHHGLSCPHAPAGGVATWDLVDAALDFYDRNCADCKLRKPVGLPNLTTLIAERDQRLAAARQAQERAEQADAARHAAREASRQTIRAGLDALSITTLNLISELDGAEGHASGEKLVEAARLAPESFTPAILEHLFDLADMREPGLAEAALRALAVLTNDNARLLCAALRLLSGFGPSRVAAEIVATSDVVCDPAFIVDALPALIHLATPARDPFIYDPPPPMPEPLQQAYRRQPDAVKTGLSSMLNETDAWKVGAVARAIPLLSKGDPTLVGFLTDDLMARLVRAKWLIAGRDDEAGHVLQDVRRALVAAFDRAPERVDELIQQYVQGASAEGVSELNRLYRDVLYRGWRDSDEIELTEAHRIAFRRLVVAATAASDSDERNDATSDLVRGRAHELAPIAAENIDLLLGSAALILQRRNEAIAKPPDPRDPLAALMRVGFQSRTTHLAKGFVHLACIGASTTGPEAIDRVLGFLANLPEGDDELRATIVEQFSEFARTTQGLQQCLPAFYSALVGRSNLLRGTAARTLGEMPRLALQNMPSLVFEAFVVLLDDPYLYVHKSAVRALERFSLPEPYAKEAQPILSHLVAHYAQNHQDDRFLVTALELYAYRYASKDALRGALGDRLLAILTALPRDIVMQEAHGAPSVLADNPKWMDLVLHLLGDDEVDEHDIERLVEQLDRRPPEDVRRVAGKLADVGVKVAKHELWQLPAFVEILSAAGAWGGAARMVREVLATIPDTVEYHSRRLHLSLYSIACEAETTIAAGEVEKLAALTDQWRNTETEIYNAENARRERAARSVFSPP